jgi:hypothetical protein
VLALHLGDGGLHALRARARPRRRRSPSRLPRESPPTPLRPLELPARQHDVAPSDASTSAMPRPMPLPPPVIRLLGPSKRPSRTPWAGSRAGFLLEDVLQHGDDRRSLRRGRDESASVSCEPDRTTDDDGA